VSSIDENPDNLYVIASDVSVIDLARVRTQCERSGSRFSLVFVPLAFAHDSNIFWSGNSAIDIKE
jgi:hypothetical protein